MAGARPQFNTPSLQELLLTARTGADQGAGAIRAGAEGAASGANLVNTLRMQELKQKIQERAATLGESRLEQEGELGRSRIKATTAQTSATREATTQRQKTAVLNRKEVRDQRIEDKKLDREFRQETAKAKINDLQLRALERRLDTNQKAQIVSVLKNPAIAREPGLIRKILNLITVDPAAGQREVFKGLQKTEQSILSRLGVSEPEFNIQDLTNRNEVKAAFVSRKITLEEANARILELEGAPKESSTLPKISPQIGLPRG